MTGCLAESAIRIAYIATPFATHHEMTRMLRAVGDAIAAGLTEHPAHTGADTIAVFRILDKLRAAIGAGTPTRRKTSNDGSK